jgi:hypothetical protein
MMTTRKSRLIPEISSEHISWRRWWWSLDMDAGLWIILLLMKSAAHQITNCLCLFLQCSGSTSIYICGVSPSNNRLRGGWID